MKNNTNKSLSTSEKGQRTKREVIFFMTWLIRLIVDAVKAGKEKKQQGKDEPV